MINPMNSSNSSNPMNSKNSIELKKGYTTGTCAQAATKASCVMLSNHAIVDKVEVETPIGERLNIAIVDQVISDDYARCAVIKDAGDDPDVTDGAKIYAEARFSEIVGVTIKGGPGVGKVTKPGLAIGVGEWAINPMPRRMILKEASKFLPEGKGGLEVTISVPEGKKIAKRTFNPKLGIVGGISIIGTTGIVEPKSLDAYKASLGLELDVLTASGYDKAVLVLGYVGERFCKDVLKINEDAVVKIGDHIGFILEKCREKKIKDILLIGHIGKLIKVANGQFNTHYKFGDSRIDSITRYAKLCSADRKTVNSLLSVTTAEATIEILRKAKLMKAFDKIAQDVSMKAMEFVKNEVKVDCILLSLEGEAIGETSHKPDS